LGLQVNEIVKRVKLVRSIIGSRPKLHLFAVANPLVVKEVRSLINSIDSSSASIAGAMKEVFRPIGGRINVNQNDQTLNCDCPVCTKHRGAIFLGGCRGSQNYYNTLRKIHNAYQLTHKLKRVLEEP
jgi:hypothetical protein